MAGFILAPQARLRQAAWTAVFGKAWLLFLVTGFLCWLLPAALAHRLHRLPLAASLLLLAAKDLSHLPDALARTRAALAARDTRALASAWFPPEFVSLLRVGRQQRHGFVQWLRRRPHAPTPPGQAFGYLELGAYRTGVAIVLLATLFELPLDAAVMPFFVKDAHKLHMLHALMLLGSVSTLVWMLGDRWWIGAGQHVLADDGLQLRIGARTTGTIPRTAILACEPLAQTAAEWCRRHGVERRHTMLASPLDKPNTVLILECDSPVRLTHFGVRQTGLACVFLYLDQPRALARALKTS